MKKILILICFCVGSIHSVFAQEQLKVMTYNIQAGQRSSIELIGKYIASENVDIAAIQECDWNNHRAHNSNPEHTDMTNVLAHETRMFPLFCKTIDFKGGYYGLGILSKYPILSSECILLPNPENSEQRAVLKARIELPSGKIITFACTHLDFNSEEVQIKQVKAINKILRGGDYTFVAGDFNAEPTSEVIQWMNRRWIDMTDQNCTFSTETPNAKLDYIFVREDDPVELLSTKVVSDCQLSDHFPVISIVQINE